LVELLDNKPKLPVSLTAPATTTLVSKQENKLPLLALMIHTCTFPTEDTFTNSQLDPLNNTTLNMNSPDINYLLVKLSLQLK